MTIETRQEAEDNITVVNDNIEKYGCHLTLIEEDNYLPAFVYSIGLFKKFGDYLFRIENRCSCINN